MKKSRTNIISYGTFDLFHYGHLRLLKRAKSLGDYLTVCVSSDEFNKEKGKRAIMPYKQRKSIIESLSCVDKVVPERNWGQKAKDIKKYDIDILVMGNDWKGEFDKLDCEVIYLKRTPGISTTKIKEIINETSKNRLN